MHHIRTEATSLPQGGRGGSAVFTIGFSVSPTYTYVSSVIYSQPFYPRITLLFRKGTEKVSTASSFGENFTNMWNPLLELLFHEQTSGEFVPNVEEIDLAKIALSCHFALDLLCYKEGGNVFFFVFDMTPLSRM